MILVVFTNCASPAPATDAGVAVDASSADPDASPPALTCRDKPAQPRDATWMVAGRSVRVHVPATYDPTHPTPVVIGLHGLASNGDDQARVSRIRAVSDAAGFIAVHPNGTGVPRGWNGGACCNPAAASGVDDAAFISAVIDELEVRLCVDPDHVHAIGLSNGAFLAHRLGCELAPRLASIAAVAGVVGIATCDPARPVPIFHVHGTSDLVIPYSGGGVNNSESVAMTIERWTTRNGCTGAPVTVLDHGDATCVVHGGCTDGADVELCTIDGGGHQWPGGESLGLFNGKKSDDLDATAAAWAFFAKHPR